MLRIGVRAGLIALILGAIGISGCSAASDSIQIPAQTPIPSDAVGMENSGMVIDRPLGSLLRSQKENEQVIDKAIDIETQKCMKEKGFDYPIYSNRGESIEELELHKTDIEYAMKVLRN